MSIAESESAQIPEPRYRRLLRISALANIAAWIALVFFLFLTIGAFLGRVNIADSLCPSIGNSNDPFAALLRRLSQEPVFAIQTLLDCLEYAFRGISSFIVLKGVGLGLDMVVETNMNRRYSETEGENE